MIPYYADESVTLYHGEALAVLASLPTGSVDAVVADPPYSSGGMMRGDRAQATVAKYVTSRNTRRDELLNFSGDSRDQHFAEVALTRIREASGQAVARGSQPALDFGEGA